MSRAGNYKETGVVQGEMESMTLECMDREVWPNRIVVIKNSCNCSTSSIGENISVPVIVFLIFCVKIMDRGDIAGKKEGGAMKRWQNKTPLPGLFITGIFSRIMTMINRPAK